MLTGRLREALAGEFVPKFLATLDREGQPNVVLISTMDAADEETLIFGELMIWKTRRNLEADSHVWVAVMTEQMEVWLMRGDFLGFVETGPHVEQMNRRNLFRYNAYMGVRRAGVIKPREMVWQGKLSALTIASELLPTKLLGPLLARPGRGVSMPELVREKFARAQALKLLAFRGEDGYPHLVPLFSMTPVGTGGLVFGTRLFEHLLEGLRPGARVAANVVTQEPVSYQVKGTYEGTAGLPLLDMGKVRVEEVFSAGPPVPGKKIV
jgi:hypothetical protein